MLTFASKKDARTFEQWWATDLSKILDESFTTKLLFGGLYAETLVARTKARVDLEVNLSTPQAELIVRTAANAAEREQARIMKRREARAAQTPQQPGATPAQP